MSQLTYIIMIVQSSGAKWVEGYVQTISCLYYNYNAISTTLYNMQVMSSLLNKWLLREARWWCLETVISVFMVGSFSYGDNVPWWKIFALEATPTLQNFFLYIDIYFRYTAIIIQQCYLQTALEIFDEAITFKIPNCSMHRVLRQ